MKTIDEGVLADYNVGAERGRLRAGLGLLEFARTKELLRKALPKPPAVIYDIGGAYGEYSWFLTSLGYEVHLFDLSETNIALSAELAGEFPGVSLAAAEVGDAREIPRADGSADAVLLMGPLYHIVEREERLAALREGRRLLKRGGVLVSSAICRYATTLWSLSVYGPGNTLLDDGAFRGMLARELADGHHIRPEHSSYHGIGRSFFHLPEELEGELREAGFLSNDIRAVEGCGVLVPDLGELWKEEARREIVLDLVRRTDREPGILGLTPHLLAISEG